MNSILKNDLAQTQASGFYKTDYLKDEVNHFSNPPYCIIKPGYRASDPFPNHNQIEVKHHYSFKPFGDQRHQRSTSCADMFNTTLRSTL